jgi:hypothetical protein
MHQLNLDLLEQLAVTCDWLQKTGIHLPNESTFLSLINKATTLLNEIEADDPKVLQYRTIRRKVTDEKSDDKVTESEKMFYGKL